MKDRASRRGALSGTSAAVLGAGTAASAQPIPAPSPILDAARAMVALYGDNFESLSVDESSTLSPQEDALMEAVLHSTPTTPAEAIVVLMVAATQLNVSNSSQGKEDAAQAGEDAVRRATRFLAQHHCLDLRALGGEHWLPVYLDAPGKDGAA